MNEIEVSELQECETVIESGLKTFMDVGTALLTIRDKRLYRDGFGTFEEYCRGRWGFTDRRARMLMSSASAVENIKNGTMVPLLPTSERQIRPLTMLEPELQQVAWTEAVERGNGKQPTGALVQEVVDEIRPHVSYNSGENEWYTPPKYIAAAVAVMGRIDIDPASSDKANEIVGASRYYTKENDGLSQIWAGRIWMNPPYSLELIKQFVSKYAEYVTDGYINEGIVLVNNATETAWFEMLVNVSDAIVFTKGRVRFLDPQGNPAGAPLQGQAIIYSGKNPDTFLSEFLQFGWGARL